MKWVHLFLGRDQWQVLVTFPVAVEQLSASQGGICSTELVTLQIFGTNRTVLQYSVPVRDIIHNSSYRKKLNVNHKSRCILRRME